jgi:enoyl-CoA hydratase/carnithine racemase
MRIGIDLASRNCCMIKLEKQGPIALLTLNRPEALNALGEPGDGENIAAACAEINADRVIRCAILTGAGKAFSAGGNVKAMQNRSGAFGGAPVRVREGYKGNVHLIVNALFNLETPLIAAVNGAAIGLGCDVACMADIRISSDRAKYGVTFLKLGLIPGDGGAWLLPRVVGFSRACELLFTGDVIDAQTALDWGLVSRVVPGDQLLAEAMSLATRIAKSAPSALRLAKTLLRQGQSASYQSVMEMSAAAQALMHHTRDHEEGVAAILEKREPSFTGE